LLKSLTIDEYKLDAIWQVLTQRLLARGVSLKNFKRTDAQQAGGSTVRQEINITQAIDADTGRKIAKFIKEQKYRRVQSSIQGDEIRVSAPSRDELQAVIHDLQAEDWGIELKFGNYR
jgi:hypothetical protein